MAAYLDHIGIAVGKNTKLAQLLAVLGLPVTGEEIVAREEVRTEWIPLPRQPGNIELLHSTREGSTIGKFLEKTGRDAVHHLSFKVDDIDAMSAELKSAGFKLIYEAPKPGAHNTLVNFVHPGTTGGVLVEIASVKN